MPKRTSLQRKVGILQPRRKIIVFSEGRNTEPEYLRNYSRLFNFSVVQVVFELLGAVPQTLVDKAIEKSREVSSRRYQRENGDRDQVWVVFDKDDHEGVEQLIRRCEQGGVNVAFSNPCFEVWLLLHFIDYDSCEHHHDTQRCCELHCPGYVRNSGKIADWSLVIPHYLRAEERAVVQLRRREQDGSAAPTTTVFRLTRAIRQQ